MSGLLHPRLDRNDHPACLDRDWQIGTGMIESMANQLAVRRLKGLDMHWSEDGALAVTALKATDHWRNLWVTLTLDARTTTNQHLPPGSHRM